ncbi:hypothetical protein ThvES_00001040 [Thiovulum sp. ES]|nr:hypothetical protein ThvES_00001040 [Thiovulum sp. ES]
MNLKEFFDFINKKKSKNFFAIINTTLTANPYVSDFPKNYFLKIEGKNNIFIEFFKSIFIFYLKMSFKLSLFVVHKIIFSIIFNKQIKDKNILIDTFLISEQVLEKNEFYDKYFQGLPEVLDKKNIEYSYLLRIFKLGINPISFFRILNILKNEKYLFDFQIVKFSDLPKIFFQIFIYPFQTLTLLDKNRQFNYHIIKDIRNQSFEAFSRYFVGKNISEMNFKKIISWNEFQVIERSFNFGYKTANGKAEIIGSQLYINYPTYFNTYIFEEDFKTLSAPHRILVNGKYYIKNNFLELGVSLRYKDLFAFKNNLDRSEILLLTPYFKDRTINLFEICKNTKLQLKLHPTQKASEFQIPESFKLVSGNLYDLFKTSEIMITDESGTAVEGVAVGVSVVIIESQNNLTANPLVEFGQGEIWEFASNREELEIAIQKLKKYRKENPERVLEISNWYKNNFFVEPTEENIIKAFDL